MANVNVPSSAVISASPEAPQNLEQQQVGLLRRGQDLSVRVASLLGNIETIGLPPDANGVRPRNIPLDTSASLNEFAHLRSLPVSPDSIGKIQHTLAAWEADEKRYTLLVSILLRPPLQE